MSNVLKPDHYSTNKLSCIEAMLEAFGKESVLTFCKLNAFKYIWRAEHKNKEEDMIKAQTYLKFYENILNDKPVYD